MYIIVLYHVFTHYDIACNDVKGASNKRDIFIENVSNYVKTLSTRMANKRITY